MQQVTQKITEDEFNQLFLDVIDETLSALGESAKAAIYFHIENRYKLKKEQIPLRVEDFSDALDKLFGIGSKPIEVMFIQRLHCKIKTEFAAIQPDDFTFPKYVNMVKKKVVSSDAAKRPAGISIPRIGQPSNMAALLNLIADPIAIVDAKGNFLFLNSAFEKTTGAENQSSAGKCFLGLPNLTQASRKILVENLRKRVSGMAIPPYEIEITDKDGKLRQFEINAKVVEYMKQTADLVICRDITQRKTNQRRLKEYAEKLEWLVEQKTTEIRESEEKLRGTFDASPDGIVVIKADGTISECNQALINMLGYPSKNELIGKKALELAAKRDQKRITERMVKSLDSGEKIASIECYMVRRDGQVVAVDFAISIIRDSLSRVTGYVGTTKNITERKQLEADLRASEEKFRAISTSATDAILLVDDADKVTYWNPGAEKIFGYTEQEAIGNKLSDMIIPAKGIKNHKRLLKRLNKIEFSRKHADCTARRKDGLEFPIELAVASVKLKSRSLMLCIIRDISERAKMEVALKRERDLLEGITQNIGAGLVIVNKDFHVLWANKLLSTSLKYDLRGKTCFSTFNNLNQICPNCGPKKIFAGATYDSREFFNKVLSDQGKPCWFELIATPIKDKDGNVTAALELTVDITERKKMEDQLAEYSQSLERMVEQRTQQLKETQEKLVKSERLAAIGELAGMVGHDLRNPLTSIKGAAYILRAKYCQGFDAKAKDMLSTIDTSIDSSNKIINDLLDYSREVTLELLETNIGTLISNSLSVLTVPSNINVENLVESVCVKVDPDKLTRVFINICKNAFDAMPAGGTLTIRSRTTKNLCEINFEDTGHGMTKETLSRLWTPLFTTKARGMGFGLAICKRIVEAHEGKIIVQSKVGKGTSFTVSIPLGNNKKVAQQIIFNPPLIETIAQ